jgi:hypothetical protein
MSFKVLELTLDSGVSPYSQWFSGLEPVVAAKDGVEIIIL